MSGVVYDDVSCVYEGAREPAVDALNLEVADGEFLVLVGPSGSGKSTALRMLAGLEGVSSGTVKIGDRDVTNVPPRERDIAMVFQSYALYPHMTVGENMGFALKLQRLPKDTIKAKVTEAARLLDLEPYLDRRPKALSGGQRQRVAMGRAIVREPSVFLMDEPLSNLDAKLRVETRANIAALQRRLGTTTVYVTHDQVEAMTMGDRVAVLKGGALQQCAPPRELYDRPANAFVAGFIGSPAMNLVTLPLTSEGIQFGDYRVPVTRAVLSAAGVDTAILGVRPESLAVAPAGEPGIQMTVELVEELGADAYLYGTVSWDGGAERLVVRVDGRTPPALGQTITVTIRNPAEVHLFHTGTGERLAA